MSQRGRISAYLHRLSDRLPWDNSWGFKTNSESLAGSNWSSTINRITQSVNYTAQELGTNRYVYNGTSSLDNISFLDKFVVT